LIEIELLTSNFPERFSS